jgi:hypothetical protein
MWCGSLWVTLSASLLHHAKHCSITRLTYLIVFPLKDMEPQPPYDNMMAQNVDELMEEPHPFQSEDPNLDANQNFLVGAEAARPRETVCNGHRRILVQQPEFLPVLQVPDEAGTEEAEAFDPTEDGVDELLNKLSMLEAHESQAHVEVCFIVLNIDRVSNRAVLIMIDQSPPLPHCIWWHAGVCACPGWS